jgi:hypothetical protein
MEMIMKQQQDSSRKPAKALPVEGGVVNRTDQWQRTQPDGGETDANASKPSRTEADSRTPEDTEAG